MTLSTSKALSMMTSSRPPLQSSGCDFDAVVGYFPDRPRARAGARKRSAPGSGHLESQCRWCFQRSPDWRKKIIDYWEKILLEHFRLSKIKEFSTLTFCGRVQKVLFCSEKIIKLVWKVSVRKITVRKKTWHHLKYLARLTMVQWQLTPVEM